MTNAADAIGYSSPRLDDKFGVTCHINKSQRPNVMWDMDLERFGVRLSEYGLKFTINNAAKDSHAVVGIVSDEVQLDCQCTVFVAAYQSREERDVALRKGVLNALAANILSLKMKLIKMEMDQSSTRDERTKNKQCTKLLELAAKFLSL